MNFPASARRVRRASSLRSWAIGCWVLALLVIQSAGWMHRFQHAEWRGLAGGSLESRAVIAGLTPTTDVDRRAPSIWGAAHDDGQCRLLDALSLGAAGLIGPPALEAPEVELEVRMAAGEALQDQRRPLHCRARSPPMTV